MVTRILFDPRRDLPDGTTTSSTSVIVQATPTGIREDGSVVVLPTTLTFTITTSADVLQLAPTTASWKWRLVVRELVDPPANPIIIPDVPFGPQPGAILDQRTVLVPDQASIAYQDLVDVDPASLGNTSSSARNWDATFGQLLDLIQQVTNAGLDDVNNWTANTVYPAGTVVLNPSAQLVQAISTFTSGSTYDSTKWTILTLNLAGVQSLIAAQAASDAATYVPLLGVLATATTAVAPTIGKTQPYNASSGALAPALPALSGLAPGAMFGVQKPVADTSANLVTVSTAAGDAFDSGSATLMLRVSGELRELQVVSIGGTKYWKVVGGNTPLGSLDLRYEGIGAGVAAARPLVYIDFSKRANGDLTGVLDSGQSYEFVQPATGRKGQVSSGKFIVGSTTSAGTGAYADYLQVPMGAPGTAIGARFVWPASPTNDGTVCLALWDSIYHASMGLNVPSSVCHFTLTPRTGTSGTWVWGAWDGLGHVITVKQGSYTNPPFDDTTPQLLDVVIDRAGGVGYAILPDGQVVTVTAADVLAAFTAAAVTPIAFKDLGSQVATLEHFATANGATAVYPEFLEFWAEGAAAPAYSKTATKFELAKSIRTLQLAAPASPTAMSYAPTTTDAVVTTTSAANVDAANVILPAVTGPTGGVLADIRAYYEFTAGDVLFWRARDTISGTTSPVQAAYKAAGAGNVLVDAQMKISGLAAGTAVNITLQHWTVTAGTATMKAGGSGGGTLPPISIKATPL